MAARQLSDQAQIHLLTCTQGDQVWSKYGHTAVRVIDPANHLDIVFNYGLFSLMDDDFYIKFVKGETYYQLGIEPYSYFMAFYSSIGRQTYWQELNLSLEQKQRIYDALITNYHPDNRYYLQLRHTPLLSYQASATRYHYIGLSRLCQPRFPIYYLPLHRTTHLGGFWYQSCFWQKS